jgi:magnesium transporter
MAKKKFSRSSKKAGLPPGCLIPNYPDKTEAVNITVVRYTEEGSSETKADSIKQVFPFKPGEITWVSIDGIHKVDIIAEIGRQLDLHPLFLEDIATIGQNPKVEDFGRYMFIILKSLTFDQAKGESAVEQISIVFGENYVITFQEHPGKIFDAIRERMRAGSARLLKMGADFLAYSLIDVIVDQYFVVQEQFGESIEATEDSLLDRPGPDVLQSIHRLKRETLFMRRSVRLAREMVNFLYMSESPLIKPATRVYLRDVYEHVVQVIDTGENYREMVFGMLDIYLSSVSYRLNEVMKVLTIISTIFIPLTFLAGVYGMNFKHMPELDQPWAYPALWVVMILSALGMLRYFKKKRWF